MNGKFVVFVLVLTVASCKCGLISWFNNWGDELDSRNTNRKCREKRETDENGIKSEIAQAAANKVVSLIDIENERKLPSGMEDVEEETGHESTGNRKNVKTKRCHPRGAEPRLRQAKLTHLLTKRTTATEKLFIEMCIACRRRLGCNLVEPCEACKVFCRRISLNSEDNDLSPTIGISNRMASPKSNDIFSKTLYPISTLRSGETKKIICKLVGITDTSDIETVTIWVTTFSNTPPKMLNSVAGDQPTSDRGNSESKEGTKIQRSKDVQDQPFPNLQPRFNEEEDENIFPRINDNESEELRQNPDVIESPPPVVGNAEQLDEANDVEESMPRNASPTQIIVEPKEFDDEADDGDDDNKTLRKSADDPSIYNNRISKIVNPSQRNLKTRRLNKKRPTEKKIISSSSSVDNSPYLSSTDPTEKGNDETTDPMNKINEAIQDVNSMVNKIQPIPHHFVDPPETTSQNYHLHTVVPKHVVKNMKKVNQYFKNRAQDVLDVIKNDDTNLGATSSPRGATPNDQHSVLTKDIIANLKKMPQFVLDRVQDSLDQFEKENFNSGNINAMKDIKQELTALQSRHGNSRENDDVQIKNAETTDITPHFVEDNQIEQRFGNVEKNTVFDEPTKDNAEEVGLPHDAISEDATRTVESPIETVKNKYDKYLADLKLKRQKLYSPEKYTTPKISKSSVPNLVTSRTSDNDNDNDDLQNTITPESKILENINKQKENIRDKIKAKIEEAKNKMSTYTPSVSSRPDNDLPNINHVEPGTNGNQFVPTEISDSPTKFLKYIDKFKSKIPPKVSLSQPDTERASSTHPFMTETPESTDNTNLEDNLNKELSRSMLGSRLGEDTTKPVTTISDFNKNKEAKKAALKARLNEYMEKLKKPSVNTNNFKGLQKERTPLIQGRFRPVTRRFESNPTTQQTDELQPENPNIIDQDAITGAREPEAKEDSKEAGDNTETALKSRSGFDDVKHDSSWSSNLGKIISEPSNANDVYFMGNGIKLPMKIKRKNDGSLDLSVDLEKLCSCKNSTCPKKSAAIEETVGAILEKEAELEDQLKISGDDTIPAISLRNSFDNEDNPSSKHTPHSRHGFKRSPDLTNIPGDILKNDKLSRNTAMFSGLQNVLQDLANLGKQLRKSFSTTAHKLEDTNKNILKNFASNTINNGKSTTTQSYIKSLNTNNPTKLQEYLKQLNSELSKHSDMTPSILQRQNWPSTTTPLIKQVLENQNKLNLRPIEDMQVNLLKQKLNELDDKVENMYENSENMIIKGGQKLISSPKNNKIDDEVNIIKKVLSWMKDFPKKSQE